MPAQSRSAPAAGPSAAGRRRIEQSANGWRFLLFAQPTIHDPYVALGPVRHVSHAGSRPISVVWELETPMPAALFRKFATLLAA